jgi:Fe-S cluster assembly scaffold protein SufB
VREPSAVVEHEASTSKIGEDQLFYFQSRGVEAEAAVGMIISGFCREVSWGRGAGTGAGAVKCHMFAGR